MARSYGCCRSGRICRPRVNPYLGLQYGRGLLKRDIFGKLDTRTISSITNFYWDCEPHLYCGCPYDYDKTSWRLNNINNDNDDAKAPSGGIVPLGPTKLSLQDKIIRIRQLQINKKLSRRKSETY